MIIWDIFKGSASLGLGSSVAKTGKAYYFTVDVTDNNGRHEVFISIESLKNMNKHLSQVISAHEDKENSNASVR